MCMILGRLECIQPCGYVPPTLEYVKYIMWLPLNKVEILVHYSYIQADTWRFGWSYTPSLLTIIIVYLGTIQRKHYSLKILFKAMLFNIHIGISFIL